jgi:hypothetical protein
MCFDVLISAMCFDVCQLLVDENMYAAGTPCFHPETYLGNVAFRLSRLVVSIQSDRIGRNSVHWPSRYASSLVMIDR